MFKVTHSESEQHEKIKIFLAEGTMLCGFKLNLSSVWKQFLHWMRPKVPVEQHFSPIEKGNGQGLRFGGNFPLLQPSSTHSLVRQYLTQYLN